MKIGITESKKKYASNSSFPTNELLAYYRMEEQSGLTGFDSWVNNLNGSFIEPVNPTTGKINSGFNFVGGSGKRMQIGLIGNRFSGKTGATFNTWIKLPAHTPTIEPQTGIARFNNANFVSHYPYTDGNIYLSLFSSTRKSIGAGIVADRTQWHMITVTADFDNNVWKFYQNAQLVHTSTVGSLTFANFIIGEATSYTLNAILDEMGFWTKPLILSDIQTVFNNGNGLSL